MLNFSIDSNPSGKRNRTTQLRHDERLAKLIERAARSLGVDKSVFLRAAVEREATRVLEAQSRHVLTEEDARLFAAALDAAPDPTPRAREAAHNYRARVVRAD